MTDESLKTIFDDEASEFTQALKNEFVGAARPIYKPDYRYAGPVTTDSPTITTGAAADVTFNESYVVTGNALPAVWPVDTFGPAQVTSGNLWSVKSSNPNVASVSTYRFMMDGSEVSWLTYASGFVADIFIDGRPYASNPVVLGTTTGFAPYGLQKLVFSDARPRLIEIRTISGISSLYTKKPYRIWKPVQDTNSSVGVVGDSFVAPYTMNDASAGTVSTGAYIKGPYQQMPYRLGITRMTTDGISGSGFIAPGGAARPYGHADRIAWRNNLNPDVWIVHGCGANDFIQGHTSASIITAATDYMLQAHEDLPTSKLVFVEGFTTPFLTPSFYNPAFTQVRTAVQANLMAEGVPVYYLDVSTTHPPIQGTGYVTAPNNSGNSDIYAGSDSTHLTVAGSTYVSGFLAPKIARVLADHGNLIDQLI